MLPNFLNILLLVSSISQNTYARNTDDKDEMIAAFPPNTHVLSPHAHQAHQDRRDQKHGPAEADRHHEWGYGFQNGPHTWAQKCQTGTRQSPIDIRTSNLEFALINELHFVNYDESGMVELKNNGHTVMATGFDKWGPRQRPYIYGGGLSGKYLLAQFHFHWAAEHDKGSEHTINALHYPAELHLVHVKDGFSLNEALGEPDGLAVVGVFYHIGTEGASMANLESALRRAAEKDSSTPIFNYTVGVHLPATVDAFYRYHGSLTTPGCNEAVVWTVLAEPMPLLAQQLALFRAIQGPLAGHRLAHNVRPVQPLNGRRVQFRASALNRHKLCSNASGSAAGPERNGAQTTQLAVKLLQFTAIFSIMITFLHKN